MSIETALKMIFPKFSIHSKPSRARIESNQWLQVQCRNIEGKVLSIGSGNDSDSQGNYYRNYFKKATSYTTSEVSGDFLCDLTLDVRSMPEIESEYYDCIYCSGVLEHVDNYQTAFNEITRILKTNGILLLGLPFHQHIHMKPNDFWRFTEYGVKYLLKDSFTIIDIIAIDRKKGKDFPAAYWVKAVKKKI